MFSSHFPLRFLLRFSSVVFFCPQVQSTVTGSLVRRWRRSCSRCRCLWCSAPSSTTARTSSSAASASRSVRPAPRRVVGPHTDRRMYHVHCCCHIMSPAFRLCSITNNVVRSSTSSSVTQVVIGREFDWTRAHRQQTDVRVQHLSF